MNVDTWMEGWMVRQVRLTRAPVVTPTPGYDVSVKRDGRDWLVTVTRQGQATRHDVARDRFLSWYAVTGQHDDVVSTHEVRRDWWLAHQDMGLPMPQSKRGQGVQVLIDSDEGVRRGRGVVRGVVRGDDVYDEALRVLEEGVA